MQVVAQMGNPWDDVEIDLCTWASTSSPPRPFIPRFTRSHHLTRKAPIRTPHGSFTAPHQIPFHSLVLASADVRLTTWDPGLHNSPLRNKDARSHMLPCMSRPGYPALLHCCCFCHSRLDVKEPAID